MNIYFLKLLFFLRETEFILKEEPSNENFEVSNQSSNYDIIYDKSDHYVSEIVNFSNNLPLNGLTSAIEENEFIVVVDDSLNMPVDDTKQQTDNEPLKTIIESQTIENSLVMKYENDNVIVGQVIVPGDNGGDQVTFFYNHVQDNQDDHVQIHFTDTNQQDINTNNEKEVDGKREIQQKA